jgi:hypothetical protein
MTMLLHRGRVYREADLAADRSVRDEANAAFTALLDYIKAQERTRDYDEFLVGYPAMQGFYLPLHLATRDPAHHDLFVVLTPGDGDHAGGLGEAFLSGRAVFVVVLPCLRGAHDPTYLVTRLSSQRRTFLHEYVHWKDLQRHSQKQQPTAEKLHEQGGGAYVNTPEEFNASGKTLVSESAPK